MDDIVRELAGADKLQAFKDLLDQYTLGQIIAMLDELATELGLTGSEILAALMDKYPVEEIIGNARGILEKLLDVSPGDLLAAIIAQAEITQEMLTGILQNFDLSTIIASLDDIVAKLHDVDVQAVFEALVGEFGLEEILANLTDILDELTGIDTRSVLEYIISQAGGVSVETLEIILQNFDLSDIVSALKEAGKSIGQIIDLLLNKSAAGDILRAIVENFNTDELTGAINDIIIKLKSAGIGTLIDQLLTKLNAGAVLTGIAGALTKDDIYNNLATIVSKLKAAGIGTIIDKLYNQAGIVLSDVLVALRDSGVLIKDIAKALKEVLNLGVVEIYNLLISLSSALSSDYTELANVLYYAGYTADAVGQVLKDIFQLNDLVVARILGACGFVAEQVAAALNSLFSLSPDQLIRCLYEGFNHSMEEAVTGLISIYNQYSDPYRLTDLLKNTNWFSATQIAQALKEGLGLLEDTVIQCLTWRGFSVNEIANALKGAFQDTAESVAQFLKNSAIFTAEQVGEAVRTAFSLGEDALRSVLGAVGYTQSVIDSVINWITSWWPF